MSFDYNRLNNIKKNKNYYSIDLDEYQQDYERKKKEREEAQAVANASTWDKIQWATQRGVSGVQSSVLDTLGAIPQSMAVGYNRGAEQAGREQTTEEKLGNTVKNIAKLFARDPISKLLYNATLGRDELINNTMKVAEQTAINMDQAENPLQKAGAFLGGLSSYALQESNPVVQELYNQGQFQGQLQGKEKAEETRDKLLKFDENIHKENDKWTEELAEEGKNYGDVANFFGDTAQTIGYMTPSIALSYIGGGAGLSQGATQALSLGQMGLASKAQATRQGLKEGLDLESADRKGIASGTAEAGSEMMFSGLKAFKTFRKSGFEDTARKWIENAVEKDIKSQLGKKVTKSVGNWLLDVAGESLEEVTTDIYNTWLDNATTDPNKQYTLEDAKNTVLQTIASTTALNAGHTIANKALNNNQILAKNQSSEYNNNESEVIDGKFDERRNQRNIGQLSEQDSRGSTTNIENTKRESISSRNGESNISEIEQVYRDAKSKQELIEYAKKNPTINVTEELAKIREEAKSIGMNLIDYNGDNSTNFGGLNNQSEVYLDTNESNYAKEEGSLTDRFHHEEIHYLKRNTSLKNTFEELQQNIVENHSDSIDNWVKAKGYEGKTPDVLKNDLAEELLADYGAKYLSGYDVEYGLPEDITYPLNTTIDDAITELKLKNNTESQQSSFNLPENYKQQQLDIINKANPMIDEYHTGIRDVKDIQTYQEAVDNDGSLDTGVTPDFTGKDIQKALDTGKITVYSSYPIEQGVFVTPSKMEAQSYAGNNQVYSKEVNLDDVAWIDSLQGQYANINSEENNIQNKSLKQRVSGDELLNAQDLIEEIKSVGGKVDDNGYVTVYHQTNQDNANKILKEGKMSGKEDGIFFSTSKNAQQSEGRGNVKLEFKIPAEKLVLDDIFDDNADIKIPLDNKNQILDVSDYLVKENKETKPNLETITKVEEPKEAVAPIKDKTAEEVKIAQVLSKPIEKQKTPQRTWALIKANLIDKGAVFEDIALKIKNRELEAKWDSTLLSGAKGQYAIGNNRYNFENGKQTQINKALTDIIDEVGTDSDAFQNYMYHQLNVDRMTLHDRFGTENKPVFGDNIGAEYSKQQIAEYEKNYPEFKEYAQDVYDYLDVNKQELVKSGVISQELSDKFKEMYPHYVPIARVDKNNQSIAVPLDTKRTGVNSPIKKAKGGSQDIQPLFQTIADKTLQTYRASARNSFGVELKNALEKLNTLNQTNENVDVDTIIDTMNDEEHTGLTEGTKTSNPTFTVFENGNKVTYDINQDMYDALKSKNEILSKLDETALLKGIQKVGNFRRGVLTEYNPVFSLTNAIKDAQDVLMNSQHAAKTYAKFPEAYAQILKKGYWYQEYVQNGGEQNSYFKDGDFEIKDTSPKGKVKSTLKMPLEAISRVNNVIEMAPRLAEYIASREAGRSVETSMLDASRVTTNFKAGGDLTKFLNRNGATFLNASVQGMAQNIRNIREANAKGFKGYAVLAGKTALAGLPALILNNLIWGDDDDYEDLQDYVKDNYYIIGKVGDHQFLRIPKGRVVAVIQKIVSNADEFINNKNQLNADELAKSFWKDLKEDFDIAMSNVAPNNFLDNNIVSPISQAMTNKTWYGSDLVPSRLQDKPNNEQYDETTAEISKNISNVLNSIGIPTSPMAINYILDQYGGGVSDILLPMGTPQAENNMLEDKFTTNSVMKAKYAGDFFSKYDELTVNNNASDASDEDIVKYKYFSSVRGEISELYKEKREIQNSNQTDEAKKKELEKVQQQINDKTKKALEEVKKPKVSGNTATIGGVDFVKTKNAKTQEYEWKKVGEDDKIDGVSLKTYADYMNKTSEELSKQRKSGEISETGQLKDKDKIQILKNSNYTDAEKKAIYADKIGTNDNLYKTVLNNSSMKIDEYLDYKAQDFKADKDENGKTISGTAKQKTIDYINSNISGYDNRLLLIASEYKLTDAEEKQKLVQWINKQPNKMDIYKQLSNNFLVQGNKVYYK